MSDHEHESNDSQPKFVRVIALAYIGRGDTPKAADQRALTVMNNANRHYQAGERVTDDPDFQVLADIDPGSGPGQIDVTDVILYGR